MQENIIFYIIIIISYFLFALFRFIRLQNGLRRRSGNNTSSWWWFCGCLCGSGRQGEIQGHGQDRLQVRRFDSELNYWYEEQYNFDEVSLHTSSRSDVGYSEQRRNYILDRIIVRVSIMSFKIQVVIMCSCLMIFIFTFK